MEPPIEATDGMLTDAEWELLQAEPEALLTDQRPGVRRLALARCGDTVADGGHQLRLAIERVLAASPDAFDRAAAAEALGRGGVAAIDALLTATTDADATVVEAAATALGRIRAVASVPRLIELADSEAPTLVREAAVASIGEIGDDRAIDLLLQLLAGGPPQVRRRCVVALTVFDDPRIEPAIRNATTDRNPMVREVAEMVAGHAAEWERVDLDRSGGSTSNSG